MVQRFKPNVTVAAVVEQDGRFLLVEEKTATGQLMLNNPAGHLEQGESPLDAVVREALEETARDFRPEFFLGAYLARVQRPGDDITYLRLAFGGTVGEQIAGRALDEGIVRTLWLTADEIRASAERHRSPLVLQCIEDLLSGRRLPLDAVHVHASVFRPS
ncbi:NUDIX hydrolase [Pelomonas sp. SE-A7]|uniref:NUDIX hydrolase n=1 Tax=Pelomonas sp. SE-A7 TaxID=3054953 RepID=UPI00259CF1F2|nr:NUDIX hydrolase [Pelomonas sp. SE-A7]MDM4767005.1 NUDIX hydrolase [Pelomonas sp. SE-A7]